MARDLTLTTPDNMTHEVVEQGRGNYVRLGCEPEYWVHIEMMLRWAQGEPKNGGLVDCMTCLVMTCQ